MPGRGEIGVKYVRYNLWPTAQFSELADFNRQAQAWADGFAAVRLHGRTCERHVDRLAHEQLHLLALSSAVI